MIESQFFTRILLIVVFGLVYVWTMLKMATYKPESEKKKKYLVMRIFGALFLTLGLLLCVFVVYDITQVRHPVEMIIPPLPPDGILRLYDPHWGYATREQSFIISNLTNAMMLFGVGFYFLGYRKSKMKWWKKILKFVFGLLLSVFYVSSTDFHYFDFWDFLPLILFVVLVFIVYIKAKKSSRNCVDSDEITDNAQKATLQQADKNTIIETDNSSFMPKKNEMDEKQVDTLDTVGHCKPDVNNFSSMESDYLRFMPKNSVVITSELEENENLESDQEKHSEVITNRFCFCPNCGKKIDYEGQFCKYCGKPIN